MTEGAAQNRVERARARAVGAWVTFALGLFAARWITERELATDSGMWFGLAAACVVGAGVASWKNKQRLLMAGLCAGLFAFGVGWYALRTGEPAAGSLARLVSTDAKGPVTVDGIVRSTPRRVAQHEGTLASFIRTTEAWRMDVRVSELITEEGVSTPATGKVWVRIDRDAPQVKAGDAVRITGLFSSPQPARNPGERDLSLLARQNGFEGLLSLSSPELVLKRESDEQPVARAWVRFRAAAEARARMVVQRAAGNDPDDPRSALLLGLILGDYDPAHRDVRDRFARVGLSHVLSISGFHLAMLALFMSWTLRVLGIGGKLRPIGICLLVLLYLVVVPAQSPIVRSAAIVFAVLASEMLSRRYDRLTLLAWVALLLLIWRPLDLWNIGYQLSVGLTAALVWTGDAFTSRLFTPPIRGEVLSPPRRMLRNAAWWFKSQCAAGTLCWLLGSPAVAFHAGIVSPLGIVATVLVTPLVVLVLLAGYAALMIGILVPGAADAASYVVGWLASFSLSMVAYLDSLPGSSFSVPPMPAAWAVLATALAAMWARRWTMRELSPWIATTLLVGWMLAIGIRNGRVSSDTLVRIDTLDVRDGTCHLIRSGDDVLLWDAGAPPSASGLQHTTTAAVRALGVWHVPRVVITHPDLDHFGAILDIAGPLGVREVITCERFVAQAAESPGSAAAAAMEGLKALGIKVRTVTEGDTIEFGSTTGRVLNPPTGATWPLDNDHSVVVQFRAMDRPLLLLTGDIEALGLTSIADAGARGLQQTVILEAPHHGSAKAGAIRAVEEIGPLFVLQSSGPSRLDDPRWGKVRQSSNWLSTASHGAIHTEVPRKGEVRVGGMLRTPEQPSSGDQESVRRPERGGGNVE